jgi:hypothetical protein
VISGRCIDNFKDTYKAQSQVPKRFDVFSSILRFSYSSTSLSFFIRSHFNYLIDLTQKIPPLARSCPGVSLYSAKRGNEMKLSKTTKRFQMKLEEGWIAVKDEAETKINDLIERAATGSLRPRADDVESSLRILALAGWSPDEFELAVRHRAKLLSLADVKAKRAELSAKLDSVLAAFEQLRDRILGNLEDYSPEAWKGHLEYQKRSEKAHEEISVFNTVEVFPAQKALEDFHKTDAAQDLERIEGLNPRNYEFFELDGGWTENDMKGLLK